MPRLTVPNAGFDREVQGTEDFQRAMSELAGRLVPHAQAAAPRKTRAYEKSLTSDGNQLVSTDPFAHLIEWGSVNNPAYAPLRNAIRSAGLRMVEA